MNLPNSLTMTRMLLAPVFVGLLWVDSFMGRCVSLAVFGLAGLTDYWDGRIARRRRSVTAFGRFMDPLADKLLISGGLLSFSSMGLAYVSGPLVLLMVGREAIVTGLRTRVLRRGRATKASSLGKWKTTLQMTFVVLVLLKLAYDAWLGLDPAVSRGEGIVSIENFLTGFFWLTAAITIGSGLDYLVRQRKLEAAALQTEA